jgi:hypothetical protein
MEDSGPTRTFPPGRLSVGNKEIPQRRERTKNLRVSPGPLGISLPQDLKFTNEQIVVLQVCLIQQVLGHARKWVL